MEENKEIKENEGIEVNETNNSIQNNNQELIPVKSNNGLVIGLVILVILLAGGLVYMLFFNKDKEEPNKNDNNITPTATPVPIEDNVTPTPIPQEENDADKKYELTVYKSTDTGLVKGVENEKDIPEWIVPAFKIKVSTKDAKVLDADNENSLFVLYNDNGLYLYDVKEQKSKKINLESGYKDYILLYSENFDKVIGIGYLKSDNKVGFYSLLSNKKLYDGKYKAYTAAGESYLEMQEVNDNYFMLRASKATYLLNTKEEKEQLSYKYNAEPGGEYLYNSYKSNNEYIYVFESCISDYCDITEIYDEQFKKIYSGEINIDIFSFYNGSIYIAEKSQNKFDLKKMDTTGKVISSNQQKNEVHVIINNYAIYEKDKTLYIMNIDNQDENIKLGKPSVDKWSIDKYFTGYYTRKDLDEIGEKNKKEGLYIVLEYEESDKDDNFGVEYCYTKDKQVIEYPATGGRAKPVLYLYPEKETNITVKFEKPNLLTTTYPKYTNSWNVTVKPNGDMKDSDGKYYYALYWDEKRYNEVDFKEGFYVEGKDAINFLEEKISIIGLNDKEKNEFIMYWLPIMEANKKNLVYFELTEEREAGNKLIISPKPDSLLRVSIHIKKVNEKVNLKEQKLPTFNRKGFTAVEWGGMTY